MRADDGMARGARALRGGGRDGFTLLEMVVSLTILAAIATFLVVTFRLAGESIARGERTALDMARLRAGTEVLQRAIRSADPLALLPAEGARVPYFRGESGRVRFLSAGAPSSVSGGGFRLLCLAGGDRPGNARGLVLSEAPPLRAEGVEGWEGADNPRVLVADASEVTFAYSRGPADDGKWEWLAAWDSREEKALPAAVRVEFVVGAEGGPRRTALVVPVPAGES